MKVQGAIIIHVKFSGAQKLKILRFCRILHVQILSGFKNWDIQDLILRRSDTLKSCRWNFFKFSWVVFIGKYGKIRLKNRRLPYKKVEQKIEQKRLLLFTFFVSFFMAFLAQKLTYTTNIYLTLCLADFLNKIIY